MRHSSRTGSEEVQRTSLRRRGCAECTQTLSPKVRRRTAKNADYRNARMLGLSQVRQAATLLSNTQINGAVSLDHLVGLGEERAWYTHVEVCCRVQIENKLEALRLVDRDVARIGS